MTKPMARGAIRPSLHLAMGTVAHVLFMLSPGLLFSRAVSRQPRFAVAPVLLMVSPG